MKLVLTNFGQDISLAGAPTTVYLVFTDEETGQVYRLPTIQETVLRLSQVLDGGYTGEPASTSEEGSEDEVQPAEPDGAHIFGGQSEDDEENVPEVPPEILPQPAPQPLRKKLAAPMSPTRAAIAKVRSRLEDHQGEAAEDSVPNM